MRLKLLHPHVQYLRNAVGRNLWVSTLWKTTCYNGQPLPHNAWATVLIAPMRPGSQGGRSVPGRHAAAPVDRRQAVARQS